MPLFNLSVDFACEPLPEVTLMYVWDPLVGTVISSPPQRIRNLMVESGAQGLNRRLDCQGDIASGFQSVFGETRGRLTGVEVMTDSNNTGSTAWFGPITFRGAPSAAAR